MAVKAVPEGMHSVTPRLFVSDDPKLVDFLKHAFGATGTFRDDGPTDVHIGDSVVMVSGTDFREATAAFLLSIPGRHECGVSAGPRGRRDLAGRAAGHVLWRPPRHGERLLVTPGRSLLTRKICHSRKFVNEPLHRGVKRQEEIMSPKVKFIPDGASAVTPYLIEDKASEMIDFYKKVFGAIETMRFDQPDGRLGHAELKINGATIMLADEFPEMGILSPKSVGGARSPVSIHLYVENVDDVYKRALAAGATSLREPADQFYGDRNAQVKDPSGHCWDLSTHIEDVSSEEMQKRLKAMTNPT